MKEGIKEPEEDFVDHKRYKIALILVPPGFIWTDAIYLGSARGNQGKFPTISVNDTVKMAELRPTHTVSGHHLADHEKPMQSNAAFYRLVASLVVQNSSEGLSDDQVTTFLELSSGFEGGHWEKTLEQAQRLAREIEALQGRSAACSDLFSSGTLLLIALLKY